MSKLIVIEGLDGSGKKTQARKLYLWLIEHGFNAHQIEFPDYESDSSFAVRMYLNGELGDNPELLNPYMCSTFYAIDRAIQYIRKHKAIFDQEDAIIVADRYISANAIHQGGKLSGIKEREDFFKWTYEFETKLMGIPQENITIFLEVPVWKSQQLMTERYNGDEGKKDIHEADVKYLETCYNNSASAIEALNKLGYRWEKINCLSVWNELKSIEEVFDEILIKVEELL